MLRAAVGPRCLSRNDEPDYNGIVNQLFREQFLLGQVTSFHEGSLDIIHGVRIMATHNVRKDVGVVNGATGIVVPVLTKSALFVHFDNGALHPV